MSGTKFFTDFAVELDRATAEGITPALVDGVTSVGFTTGLMNLLERSDGQYRNSFISLGRGDPRAVFSTLDLKAVLDKVTESALVDSDLVDNAGIVFYKRRYSSGGTRSASADAESITFADGIMVLRGITLPSGGNGRATVEVVGTSSDGSTAPHAYSETATLPSGDPAIAVAWTVGKVDLNGVQLEGVESVTLDTGIDLLVERRDSDIWPTHASVRSAQPTIRIRTAHVDITSELGEPGKYYASGVIVYARKRDLGGTFVADGTAEHIKITCGKCRVNVLRIAGDPAVVELVITPINTEGSTAPLAWSTASAIT